MSKRSIILATLLVGGCKETQAPGDEHIETPLLPWVGEHLGPALHVELYSLDATPLAEKDASLVIGGWKALEHAGPLEPEARKQAKQALRDVIASGEGVDGARCFQPHHALVAEHGGHRLEAIICFTCNNAQFFMDGALRDKLVIGDEGFEILHGLLGDPPMVGGR